MGQRETEEVFENVYFEEEGFDPDPPEDEDLEDDEEVDEDSEEDDDEGASDQDSDDDDGEEDDEEDGDEEDESEDEEEAEDEDPDPPPDASMGARAQKRIHGLLARVHKAEAIASAAQGAKPGKDGDEEAGDLEVPASSIDTSDVTKFMPKWMKKSHGEMDEAQQNWTKGTIETAANMIRAEQQHENKTYSQAQTETQQANAEFAANHEADEVKPGADPKLIRKMQSVIQSSPVLTRAYFQGNKAEKVDALENAWARAMAGAGSSASVKKKGGKKKTKRRSRPGKGKPAAARSGIRKKSQATGGKGALNRMQQYAAESADEAAG